MPYDFANSGYPAIPNGDSGAFTGVSGCASASLDTLAISGQSPKITNINGFRRLPRLGGVPAVSSGASGVSGWVVEDDPGWGKLRGEGYEDAEKYVKYIGNARIILKKTDFSSRNYQKAKVKPIRERKSCQHNYAKAVCEDCGNQYYFPISCNKRTCPDCAKEFSDRLFFRLQDVMANHPPKDEFRWRFLTLTIKTTNDDWKDGDTIRAKVKRSYNCFKKIYHNRIESGYEKILVEGKWVEKKVSYKGKVGALSVMEFGGKRLNIHLHVLVYSKWLDQKEISQEWLRLTGDSYIVHVEEVKHGNRNDALRELTKYCCDISNLSDYQKEMVEVALKGSRRVRTLGLFYNCDELKDNDEKSTRYCLKCGTELKLKYEIGGGGSIDDRIWNRILYQCAMWEISTAQLEAMMSVKEVSTGGEI